MAGEAHIKVENLRELQRAIRKQQGEMPKAIGQAHKDIGAMVIGKLPEGDPHAVGAGSGASVRPSATKREVLLRAGSGARVERASQDGVPLHWTQWGRRPVRPFAPDARPYIVGTIEENQDEIEQMFLDEMVKILGPAFFKAE